MSAIDPINQLLLVSLPMYLMEQCHTFFKFQELITLILNFRD